MRSVLMHVMSWFSGLETGICRACIGTENAVSAIDENTGRKSIGRFVRQKMTEQV